MKEKVIPCFQGLQVAHDTSVILQKETFSLQNTGMRTYTSDERLRLLQKEMNILYKQLEKLHKNPNSKITIRTICSLLKRESAFAAFKQMILLERLKLNLYKLRPILFFNELPSNTYPKPATIATHGNFNNLAAIVP